MTSTTNPVTPEERALIEQEVPESLRKYLTGATAEELTAQAADLAGIPTVAPAQVFITQLAPTGGLTPMAPPAEASGSEVYLEWKTTPRHGHYS